MALTIDCGEGKHAPLCSGVIYGASYLIPQTADEPERPCACPCHGIRASGGAPEVATATWCPHGAPTDAAYCSGCGGTPRATGGAP